MTTEPVELSSLLAARERLVHELQHGLDEDERRFLLSLVVSAPQWQLLGFDHLQQLPGIRWKLRNLRHLEQNSSRKFAEQADTLARLLA